MADPADTVPTRTRPCTNCKRNIPEDNFTIHSVYCSRNLRICQQCNEPVAIVDMEKHTAQVPCPQCREVMQACDLAAHKTDACSKTQVHCIYCELSLERISMADHELYCGTRTEKCSECSELVMIKYKKLHEDSNHGFLKLDDEPGPQPSWKVNASKSSKKLTEHSYNKHSSKLEHSRLKKDDILVDRPNPSKLSALPTSNNSISAENELDKQVLRSPTSRGAIKKRIAPQPPVNQATSGAPKSKHNVAVLKPFKHTRDVPLYKALTREQTAQRERDEENAYRYANNLPPLLTSSEKVEKLRKMSALQNMDFENELQKNQKEKFSSKSEKSRKMSNDKGETSREVANVHKDTSGTGKNVNMKSEKNHKHQCEFLEYSPNDDTLVPVSENIAFTDNPYEYLQNENKYLERSSKIKNQSTSKNPVFHNFTPKPFSDNTSKNLFNKNTESSKNNISKKSNKDNCNLEMLEYSDELDKFITNGSSPTSYEPKPVDRFCEIKNDLRALRKELKECSSPLENRQISSRQETLPCPPPLENRRVSPKQETFRSPSPLEYQRVRTNQENIHSPSPPETRRASTKRESSPTKQLDRMPFNLPVNSNVMKTDPLDLYKITNEMQPETVEMYDEGSLNFVMLPCEFCEQMIQASSLVTHETGCRPNITSFAGGKNSTGYPNSIENTAPPNTPDGHRAPKISNVNLHDGQNIVIKVNEIRSSVKPVKNSNIRSTSILSPEEQDEEAIGDLDEVKLPCEFCMILVPACRLVWHQEACYTA
ncbi:uncharacterized protein LOC143922842 [Arctopsyche grandis]|uniref:uncharacterized protein LOC143922842 n=1 Tax=Arctopsyche grandis TaxID=121162 RepID=UPI00406D99B3